MAERIADLWRVKEDAERLYSLYLSRLQRNRLHERVVLACRQIRRHATRGPGAKAGLFTFDFELDSLCDLKKYKAAWQQVRKREEIVFGKRIDYTRRVWSPGEGRELAFSYAPILYFLERYRQGCKLLETSLGSYFRGRKMMSYDVLFHVYKRDEEPQNRCCVTLSHFYDRLGKGLRDWPHWEAFVRGFHPRLFRLACVPREELLADSERLAEFFDRLMKVRAERMISGGTWGERDLIESPTKVRARQEAMLKQMKDYAEQNKPTRERTNAKLLELFPELLGLSR